jgi:hypothetical protein
MKEALLTFLAGLLFGAGLALSGMTDPSRVVGFLDLSGDSRIRDGRRSSCFFSRLLFAQEKEFNLIKNLNQIEKGTYKGTMLNNALVQDFLIEYKSYFC